MSGGGRRGKRHYPPGIFKTETGWRAFVRVRGRLYPKRFPKKTSFTTMQDWMASVITDVKRGLPVVRPEQTLADDVRRYLAQVRSMPTYEWRKADLERWVRRFGADCDRMTITAGMVREALEAWRAEGYAASTVNHRRTALMHLFTVLDGKSARNPAKDVPRYSSERRAPRALSPAVITALLDAMPESLTKARLRLMAWTGWPHAQIRRLEPSDIDWDRAVYIRPRQKGKGIEARWLPLLPHAWDALRTFKQLGAWGDFSTSSMRKSLRLAATKIGQQADASDTLKRAVANITPYDLRHSFLTMVAVMSRNQRAVQTLGLHADARQSQRYTEAAVDPLVLAAIQEVTSQLPPAPKSDESREQADDS